LLYPKIVANNKVTEEEGWHEENSFDPQKEFDG
jgi:hypothetical protein